MSVRDLLSTIRADREHLDRVKSALSRLLTRQKNKDSYYIGGFGVTDMVLASGKTMQQTTIEMLQEVEAFYTKRILANTKIIETADVLVRGLASGSQDHEPA